MFTRKPETEDNGENLEPLAMGGIPDAKRLPNIEPKKILPLKQATELADKLSHDSKRLIYVVYGVASGYRNTENGGIIAPRFGGAFEVFTPDMRTAYKAKYCFLPGGIQGTIVEKLKELGSVEFIAKVFLVRNDHKFMRFEYKAEIDTLRQVDSLAAIRKQAAGVK